MFVKQSLKALSLHFMVWISSWSRTFWNLNKQTYLLEHLQWQNCAAVLSKTVSRHQYRRPEIQGSLEGRMIPQSKRQSTKQKYFNHRARWSFPSSITLHFHNCSILLVLPLTQSQVCPGNPLRFRTVFQQLFQTIPDQRQTRQQKRVFQI